MAHSTVTTDHEQIRAWVEARDGRPAHVKRTGREGDPGILRVDYPGFSGEEALETMGWTDWFAAFDANKLAFLHDDEPRSRFSKLVARATVATPRRATAAMRTTAKRTTGKRTVKKRKAGSAHEPTKKAKKSAARRAPRPMAARAGKDGVTRAVPAKKKRASAEGASKARRRSAKPIKKT